MDYYHCHECSEELHDEFITVRQGDKVERFCCETCCEAWLSGLEDNRAP